MSKRGKRFRKNLISVGNGNLGDFAPRLRQRHVNAEKTIYISSLGLAEIVTRRQFKEAFKWTVTDFHHQKAALGSAASVRTISTDPETLTLDGNFQIFTAHSGKLDLDDEAVVGGINISVGNPLRLGGAFLRTGRPGHKMNGRTDFAHGHYGVEIISGLKSAQAHYLNLTMISGRSPFLARYTTECCG